MLAEQWKGYSKQREWDTEGRLERVDLEPERFCAVSISSDDDPDSTEQSDSKSDTEDRSDVDKHMEEDVDAPYGVNLDGDVDMERDSDDEEGEDKEEEDEEEDEEEEQDEDEDKQEDEDEDDGKEPRTIGKGEMVNTLAHDVYTMADDQSIVLPKYGQGMRVHTPPIQHLPPAPRPQTLEPRL